MMLRSACLVAALGIAAFAIAARPAAAQSVAASDPESVLQAIRAHGHKAKLEHDSEGYPIIHVTRAGINYAVYFYGCDGNPADCRDLQFSSGFDVEPALTDAWANAWNRQWVAGRAEIDEEGDPRLTYFVTTGSGLPEEHFQEIMQVWDVTLDGFMEDIGW